MICDLTRLKSHFIRHLLLQTKKPTLTLKKANLCCTQLNADYCCSLFCHLIITFYRKNITQTQQHAFLANHLTGSFFLSFFLSAASNSRVTERKGTIADPIPPTPVAIRIMSVNRQRLQWPAKWLYFLAIFILHSQIASAVASTGKGNLIFP